MDTNDLQQTNAPYQFAPNELDCEVTKRWVPPILEVTYKNEHFSVLRIGRHHIAWPASYSVTDLPWLYNEVFLPASGNPHAYEVGDVQLTPGCWAIDAGACEGFFTWYALERGANVCIVEPVRLLCESLSVTFAEHIREGKVRIVHGCIGATQGLINISTNPNHICESKATDTGLSETVPMYTIDSLVQYGLVPRIDFLKMDIEGAEMEALKGACITLKDQKPKLAIAVYHEVPNANLTGAIALQHNANYRITFRGRYDWDGCVARPFMLYGA